MGEWIAVQLEAAGYTIVLQRWNFRPGSDFLHEMQQATSSAERTVAVLSPAYFGSAFSEAEWRAEFHKDPTGEQGCWCEQGDQRRVAMAWSLSLDRVHQEAPAAEALLSLCAFLPPDIPRGLPREQPQALLEELTHTGKRPAVYNRMLMVVGRYSLATVTPLRSEGECGDLEGRRPCQCRPAS